MIVYDSISGHNFFWKGDVVVGGVSCYNAVLVLGDSRLKTHARCYCKLQACAVDLRLTWVVIYVLSLSLGTRP